MYNEILAKIRSQLPVGPRKVIFICGLGGAGKTKFSNGLKEQLGADCVIMQHDWYLAHPTLVRKRRMQRAKASGDLTQIEAEGNPFNWYNNDKFIQDLRQLRDTGTLTLSNAWSQANGELDLSLSLSVPAGGIILVDGIYLLHKPTVDLADLVMKLQISAEVARTRADQRDSYRSDKDYLAYKRQLVEKYDFPYFKKHAQSVDIIIDNSDYHSPRLVN